MIPLSPLIYTLIYCWKKAADGLMQAIENVAASSIKTKKLGGSETTKGRD